jgi:hypothetical protein
VDVAADALALAADDEGDLAVGLEPEQPVDDVDACLLERAAPLDVRLLVERAPRRAAVTLLPPKLRIP